MANPKRLTAGETPPKGGIVELCLAGTEGFGRGDNTPVVKEEFTATGEWTCPKTENGYFYRVWT